jgi:cytochrome c5
MSGKFLELEYLLDGVAIPENERLKVHSSVLRAKWYKEVYGIDRYKELIDPATKFPFEISKVGQSTGLFATTSSSGAQYRAECRDAQVPIPPRWGDKDKWVYEGDLNTNFLGLGNPSEVWSFKSIEPKGICVALPRISGSNISALGIICLGTESNNACFYDAEDVPVGAEKPIEEFLAGADLFNGVCTDCHAGENPYVVHPSGPLNLAPDHRGIGIVH